MDAELYSSIKKEKNSRKILDIISENLSVGIVGYCLEKDYPFYYINKQILDYLGYTYKEFLEFTGGYLFNIIFPEDRDDVDRAIQSYSKTSKEYQIEYRMISKDGNILWIRDRGKFIFLEEGQVQVISVLIDISEDIKLNNDLEVKNQELLEIVNSLPCGVCKIKIDPFFTIVFANQSYYQLFDYTNEEAGAAGFLTASAVIDPDYMKELIDIVNKNIASHCYQFELEHRCINKTGKKIWMLARCNYDPKNPECIMAVLLNITDRKNMEEQLRISEEQNRIAIQHTDKMIDIYDVATKTLYQPQKAADSFALPLIVENVPYSIVERGLVDKDSMNDYINFYESMMQGSPSGTVIVRMLNNNKQLRWYLSQYTMIFSEEGFPEKAVLSFEDITEQRIKEMAYQKWIHHFESLQMESIGYYEYNLTKDIYERSEGDIQTKLPLSVRSFSGTAKYISQHWIVKEDREKYLEVFNRERLMMQYYQGKREIQLEHRRKGSSDEIFWVRGVIQLISDPYTDEVKAFVLIQNIDEEKKETLNIKKIAERDELTGLFNRRTIIDRISEVLCQDDGLTRHAVIMLDIDNFKGLNDNFGHQYGDFVLEDFSNMLKKVLYDEELCGRIGGDEFVILLNNISRNYDMKQRLDKLCIDLSKSYETGASLSCSMGVAYYPRDGEQFEELYKKADLALYQAKKNGRNQYAVYDFQTNKTCNEHNIYE